MIDMVPPKELPLNADLQALVVAIKTTQDAVRELEKRIESLAKATSATKRGRPKKVDSGK